MADDTSNPVLREKARANVLKALGQLQERLSNLERYMYAAHPEEETQPGQITVGLAAEHLGRQALAVAMSAAQFCAYLEA